MPTVMSALVGPEDCLSRCAGEIDSTQRINGISSMSGAAKGLL
jgi:hypothetical protein